MIHVFTTWMSRCFTKKFCEMNFVSKKLKIHWYADPHTHDIKKFQSEKSKMFTLRKWQKKVDLPEFCIECNSVHIIFYLIVQVILNCLSDCVQFIHKRIVLKLTTFSCIVLWTLIRLKTIRMCVYVCNRFDCNELNIG